MIHVDPNWWQSLFDEVYLITDAPFVTNPALTKSEVDVLEQVVNLQPSDRILDLCGGQGRHALELSQRGYERVFVLDYSHFLLRRGHQDATAGSLEVEFVRGDARHLPLATASVDVVLLMANSFGYFADPSDDQRLLVEVARVLTPKGRLVLDLTDYDHAAHHFCPESWHEATPDVVVCWKREWVDNVIRVREMVLSKAISENDFTMFMR